MSKKFMDELTRLLEASRDGVFHLALNSDGMTDDEAQIIRMLGEVSKNYKDTMEFDIMKYKLTSDALGIALWDMDIVPDAPADGNSRLVWSQEAREMLGFKDEKDFPNLLSSLTDRIHPQDRDKALKAFADHIADKTGKTPFDEQYRLMMRNGQYRYFHAFGTTLRDSDGNALRVAGAIEDIDAKKQMEESLQKAEEERIALANLNNILNGLNAMICVTDPDTDELLFINDNMKNAFGVDYDCTGQKCYKVLRDYDERCSICPCTQLSLNPDREIAWEHTSKVPGRVYRSISRYVKWPGGKTVHIQNAIDITDIIEREREIAEKNEFNQILMSHAPVGVTLYDENFNFIDCNENILEMFGGMTREAYSKFFGGPAHSPPTQPDGRDSHEKAMELITRSVIDGEKIKAEWIHSTPDGEPFPVELTMTRIKRDNKYIGLTYIYDMREQTRLKEDLEAALHRAEDANKAKSDFLAKMSHEIRTPMNAILGITEIQMRSGTLSSETEEALGQIYDSGNLLMGIINDILDLSKIEADKLEIIPVTYDIMSLVNDTAQLNRMRCSSELIEFDIDLSPDTPHNMIGDELRIKQILNNVLSNAFKYTEKGRITFSIRSEPIAGSKDEVMLIFVISDTGQGMSTEQLELLFTDYTRFNLETNRTTSGTGLGLSITKRLTDLMGGTVVVDSEVGRGTTFSISIPQKRFGTEICGAEMAEKLRDARYRSTSYTKKTQFVREYMPYGSVMVVDDVESNLYVTKGMLLPYGLLIDIASSGFEVIEKVKRGYVYDIIFMDHMMPVMDGIEATAQIRATGYTGTIIALTANALIGQSDIFLQNGFDGFVSKPIDSRELNHVLNEFIKNKKPADVVEAARQEQAARQGKTIRRKKHKDAGKSGSEPNEAAVRQSELKKLIVRDASKAIATLERTFASMCLTDNNSAPADLSETDIEKDLDTYIITVHGMKSALANIGEADMSAASQRLELAGKERELSIIEKETPDFIASLRGLINELDIPETPQAAKTGTEPAAADADTGYLKEKLLEIKSACETYNVTAARAALGSLTERTWPKQVSDALEEINIHLLHSDFDEAAGVAGEHAAKL